MNKYVSRITSSERGEAFNPLIAPFFLSTLAYGLGFSVFMNTTAVGQSSLYLSMVTIGGEVFPLIWGVGALIVIVGGLTALMFNVPPARKLSGLFGFSLWAFASFCWGITGGWLLVFAIGIPSMWFWFWQYLSLSRFRGQDSDDKKTMAHYHHGDYDDEQNPKDSKIDREDNRGRDVQRYGSYDEPDNGGDVSRVLDTD